MKVQVNKMFDIDKLNIYWAKDTENKIFGSLTEDDLFEKYNAFNENAVEQGEESISFEDYKLYYKSGPDRFLLELEKSILLHPRNAHHLLMPLTDEIFVQDIYNNMLKEGLINKPQSSYFSSLLPSTNVRNTVIFVKGKYGVGPVALGITGMATNQADTLNIGQVYNTQDREIRPTKLLFKGMEDRYNLDSYVDLNGVVISETNSQLLTTQVDNVKNPTAVLMNINMQTLGVLNYLIRRGVSPQSAILLLNQPLVKAYLSAQKLNESLFNKNIKHAELSKSKLITKLLLDSGYPTTELPDIFDQPDAFILDDSKMLAAAKSGKLDNEQLLYLSYFVNDLQPQARAFSDFQQSQTSDTKGLKDRQAWDEAEAIENRVFLSEIVKQIDVARINSRGVIAPFYQYGRRNYNIFKPFYSLVNSVFGEDLLDLKNAAAERMAGLDKDRVRQTIENDFILYLIHKFVTNKQEFDRLTKGNSVAKRVQYLKTKVPSNLVLKAFLPMLKNTVDNTTNETIDNLRLFEKDLSGLDSNDLRLSMEEIADLDMELYNDIIKLLMFQSGLNTSILNYSSIVPVGLNSKRDDLNQYMYVYQDLLQDAMKALKEETNNIKMFAEFKLLFAANNPKFLSTNPQYPGVFPLARVWMREQEKEVLMNKNMVQAQLGDAYHKQYFPELIDLQKMDVSKKAQDSNNDKNILNDMFEDKPVTSSVPKSVEPPNKPSSINIYSTDKNGFQKLSNLADREFTDKDGRKYHSVEHAYQSWKSGSFDEETYKKYTKGGVKISGNKGTKIESNWNISLMKRLIRLSLEQNPDLMDLLVSTGNIPLTHTQDNTIWKTEFPKILMELRDEFKSGYQSLFDADKGQSQYSPSLKMYEGFINLNQLYQGDEILPFIGESEYYRYLVPMLLKMNPKAQTMFTHHMKYFAREIGMQKNMDLDFFNSLNNTSIGGDAGGIAVREIDSSFVRPDEPVKSLVHELVHLTLQKEYEKGTEFKQKIDELYKYAWDKQVTDGTYGFTSPKEFLAEAMSNPDFMQELNEIQYGDETVWSYLMTLVSDFINKLLNIELKSDSVLAAVVRASEQVLQHNITELSKESEINPSEIQKDILENWTSYFPQYEWMNDQQKQITAQLVEEGKLTLHCKI